MPRKKPITNQEVLQKLESIGVYKKRKKDGEKDNFSTVFNSYDRWNPEFSRWNLEWDYGKKPGSPPAPEAPDRYITYYTYNYMIPIDIYKEHINKRFKGEFKVGEMVRILQKTKRSNSRNKWNTAIGDSQDYRHLGIGSGKKYLSEDQKDMINSLGHSYTYSMRHIDNRILIGNNNYIANIMAAYRQSKAYTNAGIFLPKRYFWQRDNNPILPSYLYDKIKISGKGILGPKQLINGFITNVFVHFLYPRWKTKREARYQILLETGAKGIWTNDYINRVYDTDYEIDEVLMAGCPCKHCNMKLKCDHTEVHLHIDECDEVCPINEDTCKYIYDYRKLGDTTYGMALDIKKEEDKEKEEGNSRG